MVKLIAYVVALIAPIDDQPEVPSTCATLIDPTLVDPAGSNDVQNYWVMRSQMASMFTSGIH